MYMYSRTKSDNTKNKTFSAGTYHMADGMPLMQLYESTSICAIHSFSGGVGGGGGGGDNTL